MFRRKTVLIPRTEMTVGEFDPEADGAYRNVKTMPLEVRPGRDLYIQLRADAPVDLALSDGDGRCVGFRDGMTEGTFGPLPLSRKETMALMMGVFRGDLARMTIEAWME